MRGDFIMLALSKVENSVVNLQNDSLNEYYEVFLGKQSENTAKAYKTAINLMSKLFFQKEMKFVTLTELRSIKMLDIMKLYQWLEEKVDDGIGGVKPRYKTATINKHVNGMKSFFRFLNKEFKDISEDVFGNIDLKSPDLDSNGWGGLEWIEAIAIWEYAQDNMGEKSNKLSMLFKLASVTSIRLEALLSLEWGVHWFTKVEHGMTINYVDVIDKNKRHKKPVSEMFYNELREKLTDDKLFKGLNKDNVGEKLKECLDALNYDSRRNIKFHSFKKAGVMRALEVTDNMYKAKEQGNHSSMTTAEKYYLKYKESLMDMVSFSIDQTVDVEDELDDYSKEELVQAISKMREVSQKELIQILKGVRG